MTKLILNQAQAEAIYEAMCHLNNVSMRIDGCVAAGIRCREDEGGAVFVFDTRAGHTGGPCEEYENQSAFATAYGLDEPTDRAQMVVQGTHPWIYYANVLSEFGLDESFVWTATTLSPYVEQYMQAHKG